MVELYRIGVNEISFFCQFYLRNITDSSRYDFRYAPFPPSPGNRLWRFPAALPQAIPGQETMGKNHRNAYISGLSQHGYYPVPLLPGEIPDRISIGRILLYCCIPVY